MKSRVAIVFLVAMALLLGFNSGYLLGQSPVAPFDVFPSGRMPAEVEEEFEPFWEVYNMIQTRYFQQPVDNEKLVEGAITGMLDTLEDPHTVYLSPAAEEAQRQGFDGELHGIGVEVTSEEGSITVVSPIEGSPAFEAGLQPGDILRQADGVELTGLSVTEAAEYVRGPIGTTVRLVIERDGETFELDVMRDVIKIASVRGEILEGNIAHVRLSHFGTRTTQELEEVLEELLAQNPDGLILDLRRNPGGGLDTVVDIADQFLPEGTVLVQEFGGGLDRTFSSTDRGLAEDIPLVVLIDEGSASASEVLAGAIRDRGRGILIGQTSYGKGTVQTWQPLSNGGGLRLTIARWLTPERSWVDQIGLEPDYQISLPEVETPEDFEEFEDTQLEAAVGYLLGEDLMTAPVQEGS